MITQQCVVSPLHMWEGPLVKDPCSFSRIAEEAEAHSNVSHRLCAPLSHCRLALYREGVATVSLADADCSLHTQSLFALPPSFFFFSFFKLICMQYVTLTLRLHQKLLLGPDTREQPSRDVLINKLESYRSNQALTASKGENAVLANIVFTENCSI